jgi:protein-S-isoprenylcysteine O-methyltransferase Ste14
VSPQRRWPARILAVSELAAFFVIERRLRRGSAAATLERGAHDRGSTMAIGTAFGIAMTLTPLASALRRGRLRPAVGWAGVVAMATGIAVRAWAARTLGASYTRTLRVAADQRVANAGPYAYVRHPGYAADLLMWVGYGMAWSSLPAVLAAILPTAIAYAYRIPVEEAMMRAHFGPDYERYAARTARLLPRVW